MYETIMAAFMNVLLNEKLHFQVETAGVCVVVLEISNFVCSISWQLLLSWSVRREHTLCQHFFHFGRGFARKLLRDIVFV